MRKYELVCIVQPELDETAFKGVVDRVSSWVTDAGGSVDKWTSGDAAGWHTRSASSAKVSMF